MNRAKAIVALRPTIHTIENNADTSELELFQNAVLRPILKLQHDIILSHFKHYLGANKLKFELLNQVEKEKHVQNLFQKQIAFRNQIIGIVSAFFTLDETNHFLSNYNSISRRILSLAKQRILSEWVK